MQKDESLERHGSNGASASLAAGAAAAAPLQVSQVHRRKKAVTRGRALREILSELQQIHDERMQQYQELMQEHQALRIRQRVTSLWLAQMELLIEVTADLRRTCGKPGAARTAGAEVAASAYASAAAAAAAAAEGPVEAAGNSNTAGAADGLPPHASRSDGAVQEDFLARCLSMVRTLRLEGPGQRGAHNGAGGGSVGGSEATTGNASGASTRKLRRRNCKEAAVPGNCITHPGSNTAGATAPHIEASPGRHPANEPPLPGWVEKLRRLENDEDQRKARLKDPAFMLSSFVRDFVHATAVDLCQSSMVRLDTMQPYHDAPPTVEHWATVCREMRLVGQQEAEVVELLAQWLPAVTPSTARRDELLATHAALLSAAPPAAPEELERLMAEVERANAEIVFKAGAFALALWAEILQPEHCASAVIASYPFTCNLRALEAGMRHLLQTRDAPPPALLAPLQPPSSADPPPPV